MATILLSTAGAAIGGSVGGSVLGLSMAAVGRFAGATLGRAIDQKIMGNGSDVVEHGKVERFRLTNAGEGDPQKLLFGRMRLAGQVIWATQFQEAATVTGGGKGFASGPKTKEYSYSVSLAIALCSGEISGVGRLWADGVEIDPDAVNMRVYRGTADQQPDPKMEAVEGEGNVPAYRGTAYVVFEELSLQQFGNRVPQFEFEVMRPEQTQMDAPLYDMAHAVQGVALLPGSGEYALATQNVSLDYGAGHSALPNVNTPTGSADFLVGVRRMKTELKSLKSTSLIVSWFGSDLRCGSCEIKPKVEQSETDGAEMPWTSAGLARDEAETVPRDAQDRPVYGGTPTDQSIVEAIEHLNENGLNVLYYPFILMDQMEGNDLPDPYSGSLGQSVLPWRGRITLSLAPGQSGSPDGTSAASSEIDAFFGTASASDFTIEGKSVVYSGPGEWSYRRFILHNAALCAVAGGVDAFSIGSEMRELTKLRGSAGFEAVTHLKALAAEARALLGSGVKIGYCADWSEYFGFNDNGDRYFHLDPLWADPNIDFVGIDNYMPLSDWREGEDAADAAYGSVYNLDYLEANVMGGEGFDWYYQSPEDREAQIRTPITDGEHGEPWIWRYKDVRSWWASDHHERIGGQRSQTPTAWIPQSKPIWFTELGCAAIDKGTNQPNKFLDPKSSESRLPYFSNGRRDEYNQAQYLRAIHKFWSQEENNPISVEYGAPMLDLSRAFVWAWDARPYPHFPAMGQVWSDGANYEFGHWITGRASARSLASVVAELCTYAGCENFDVSDLKGMVDGYAIEQGGTVRSALQPLMLAYGFDVIEREGMLIFEMRDGLGDAGLERETLAVSGELDAELEVTRAAEAEKTGRIRLRFFERGADFDAIAEEEILPEEATHSVAASEVPLVLPRDRAKETIRRWLAEAQVSRERYRFALPPSKSNIGAGDIVLLSVDGRKVRLKIESVDIGAERVVSAVRCEPESYTPSSIPAEAPSLPTFVPPVPAFALLLDLPKLKKRDALVAPHIAVTAKPWPGTAALYASDEEDGFEFEQLIEHRATIGLLQTPIKRASPGLYDRGNKPIIKLTSGSFNSVTEKRLLKGRNLLAIGDGSPTGWELLQFRKARPVGDGAYEISQLLRGQLGSDAWQPAEWPVGSYAVFMDAALERVIWPETDLSAERFFRVGPAAESFDHASYSAFTAEFDQVSLKPLSPCHLTMLRQPNGDVDVTWIRRSRIDADSWDSDEIPLGEESERYRVRVKQGGAVIRESFVTVPQWTYTSAMQSADGVPSGAKVEIGQVSADYGVGATAKKPLPV